jgi:hypothetical protein
MDDLKRWRRTEERIADDLGGHAQAGSGNQANFRGDIRVHGFLRVQGKTVLKGRSTSLKLDDWEEVLDQALRAGEMPAMVYRFVEGRDTLLAVIDYDDFQELMKLKKERDGE